MSPTFKMDIFNGNEEMLHEFNRILADYAAVNKRLREFNEKWHLTVNETEVHSTTKKSTPVPTVPLSM